MNKKRNILSGDIKLIEPEHKYIVTNFEHLQFTSATTFIKQFFKPFDSESVAGDLAGSNNANYGHLTKDKILSQWDKVAEDGTYVHEEIEKWILDKTFVPTHPKSVFGINWLKENLKPDYIVYPEVSIYSLKLQLAGTIDLLIHEPKEDLWIMGDWKTNKRIYTSSYDNAKGTHRATMNLQDSNYNHYQCQMSLYQWILKKEYGINIFKRVLLHLKEKETKTYPLGVQEYWTDYLKPNIEKMVEHRLWEKEQGLLPVDSV